MTTQSYASCECSEKKFEIAKNVFQAVLWKNCLHYRPRKKNLSPIFVKNSEIIAFCLKSSEPCEFCMSLFGTEMWQFFDFSFFYSVRVFVMNNVCHFFYSTKVRIILISLTFSRYKRFYFHFLTVRLTVY